MSSSNTYKPVKVFSLEDANRTLPLVRAITSDLIALSREVTERRERLSYLTAGREVASADPYDEELTQIEEELEKDADRLREYVEELRQLGVEPKSATHGLVDFPAELDGRLVYLCWKYNESEIRFWHDLEAGFEGRTPLKAISSASGSREHDREGLDG